MCCDAMAAASRAGCVGDVPSTLCPSPDSLPAPGMPVTFRLCMKTKTVIKYSASGSSALVSRGAAKDFLP